MNRILRLLIPIAIVFFGRQIYADRSSGPPDASSAHPAVQHSQQPGWITEKFAGLLQNMTGTELSPQDMRLLSVLIFVFSFALGLVAHLILGSRAFGRGLNGLIALFGAAAAVFCLRWLPPGMRASGLGWEIAVAIFSSFLFLGAAVAIKAFVLLEAEDFALGNGTRTGGAMKALTGAAPKSQVSPDRIQRALRRT